MQVKEEFEASIAPEICIEIEYSSNTQQELESKKILYFEAGAKEFWLCDEAGRIRFWDFQKPLDQSRLVPQFPKKVEAWWDFAKENFVKKEI